jgi:hypothetical protein
MSTSVTVTLGRNIGSEPMPEWQWDAFTLDVRKALSANTTGPDRFSETHTGTGQWQGVTEESRKITVHAVEVILSEGLRARLWDLARHYGQDAVALTIGETHLIG